MGVTKTLRAFVSGLVLASLAQPLSANEMASAVLSHGTLKSEGPERALYEAGSITKFACTIAVLRLNDRGTLDIDTSLGELIEKAAGTPIKDVTLRQVLQSRSGIADGLMPAFREDAGAVLQTPNAVEALRKYALGELAHEPGTLWAYELVNWIVVQAAVEQATGKPVCEVLHQLVLRPAGMGQSRIFSGTIGEDAEPPAQAGLPIPGFLTCAGGLATTPTDLIALARFAHKGGLSARSLEALQSIATPEENYALGGRFVDRNDGDTRKLSWQTGSNGAYKSLLVYDPASDSGFAAMTASGSNTAIQSARDAWLKQVMGWND